VLAFSTQMGLEVGDVIDQKYRVTRQIGRGGMGEVWEGENLRIRRRVAIKVLHAAAASSPELVGRFEREAQAAGCIGSDHILEILDLGALPNGDRYMVMEFLDGEPLSKRLDRTRPMDPVTALSITRQVLEGLHAAHSAGIVHRDLKPDNIFIIRQKAGRKDFVKIIDFGISKFSRDGDALNMTRAGSMMGTPLYMSPEQARSSAEADQRSDIYAMGVILHEMLSGQTPFRAQTFNELLFEIALAELPRIETFVPGIDPEIANIVRMAMERDRNKRYSSALEMSAAIDPVLARLQGHPDQASAEFRAAAQVLNRNAPSGSNTLAADASNAFSAMGGNTPFPNAGQQFGGNTPFPAGGYPSGNTPFPNAGSGPYPQASATGSGQYQQVQIHGQTPLPEQSTQQSWQQQTGTGNVQTPPKKSNAGMLFALIAVAVVVLGGGAFAASRIFGGSSDEAKSDKTEKADKKEKTDKAPAKNDPEKGDEPEKDKKDPEPKPDPKPEDLNEPVASASVTAKPTVTAPPATTTTAPKIVPTGTVAKPKSTKPGGPATPDFGY
jgi:eukaryotic-like serine/threonine-protein kinase